MKILSDPSNYTIVLDFKISERIGTKMLHEHCLDVGLVRASVPTIHVKFIFRRQGVAAIRARYLRNQAFRRMTTRCEEYGWSSVTRILAFEICRLSSLNK